ncbi:MAG: hypothetical protein P4L35_18775 [Ignavibacteriaceae bacterium]|nr:hypothetical protein [Ignavibacteriaceae bacterium]
MSDTDIKKVLRPNKVNIIEYENLPSYNHIDDLFAGSDVPYCVLFIPEDSKMDNIGLVSFVTKMVIMNILTLIKITPPIVK